MEVKLVPSLTNMVKKLLIVFYPWQVFCLSRIENVSIDSTERTAFYSSIAADVFVSLILKKTNRYCIKRLYSTKCTIKCNFCVRLECKQGSAVTGKSIHSSLINTTFCI